MDGDSLQLQLVANLLLRSKVCIYGRVIAQAVSRRLPTAAARVRAGSGHVGFVVDKVALGQLFSKYFGFPCPSSFHQLLHNHYHLGLVQ
jgi:hypothetical protein